MKKNSIWIVFIIALFFCLSMLIITNSYSIKPFEAKYSKSLGKYRSKQYSIVPTMGAKQISAWHDIPLKTQNSKYYNFVVEIPINTNAKMELNKKLKGNPIMQDLNIDGSLRYLPNKLFYNYGFLPQTYQDVNTINTETGFAGDGDPLDVIEIGETALPMASIIPIKVIGSFLVIDEDKTDYNIVALRSSYPNLSNINSLQDLEKCRPGIVNRLIESITENNNTSMTIGTENSISKTPYSSNKTKQIIEDAFHMYWQMDNR